MGPLHTAAEGGELAALRDQAPARARWPTNFDELRVRWPRADWGRLGWRPWYINQGEASYRDRRKVAYEGSGAPRCCRPIGAPGWPRVWLGTTVESMAEARLLLWIPSVCHFLSSEQLLEPL
jgi:hypothetical protein